MARHAMRSLLLTAITAAVATAAAAGIALAALDRPDPDRHPHLDLGNGLLVTTRTELRLCVEPGTERQPAVEGRLLAALDKVRRHPHWSGAYGRARYHRSSVLAWGCPAPQLPERYEPKAALAGPGVTAEPSPYRVWIYVLDEPTADRVLGADRAAGTATAELMRDAQRLFPVSTALLIRQARLTDTAATARDLRAALGLDADGTREEHAR